MAFYNFIGFPERMLRDRISQVIFLVSEKDKKYNELSRYYLTFQYTTGLVNGSYEAKNKEIKVSNLHRAAEDLFISALIQLARHYNFILNDNIQQKVDHQYYLYLRVFLQASIDLDIITKKMVKDYARKYDIKTFKRLQEEVGSLNDLYDSRHKGMSNYYYIIVRKVKSNELKNLLRNAGKQNDQLERMPGYIFDNSLRAYVRYGERKNLDKEKKYLESIKSYAAEDHAEVTIIEDNTLKFTLFCILSVSEFVPNETFIELLKTMKFKYEPSSSMRRVAWKKIIPLYEVPDIIAILREQIKLVTIKVYKIK